MLKFSNNVVVERQKRGKLDKPEVSKPPFSCLFPHSKCMAYYIFVRFFLGYIMLSFKIETVAENKILTVERVCTGYSVFRLPCLKPRLRKEYSWIAGLCFNCKIFYAELLNHNICSVKCLSVNGFA